MRLKTQREDVKYLEKLAENRLSLRPIARRYLNLIRMADWIESECYCPCCNETKECVEDCTYEEDDREGWRHMISAMLARWGQ